MLDGFPIYIDTKKVIYGKNIKETPKNIADVKTDDGIITVWGDVLKHEERETKRGGNKIFSFDITDYTSSVTVKMFDANDVIDPIVAKISSGGTVIINGAYQFDQYSNGYVLRPRSIATVLKQEKEDNEPEKRIELHMHTALSEMDAISTPKSLVKQAIKWGHSAVAITDHGVVQALPEAFNTAYDKKYCEDGNFKDQNGTFKYVPKIKLILGMEGYLVDDEKYPDFMNMKLSQFPRYHIILLVKEDTSMDESIPKEQRKYGRKNLYELISASNVKYFKSRPLIPKSLLAKKREGIIIGSACERGELYQSILEGIEGEELEKIASFYDYLEIQPNGNNAFMLRTSDKEYVVNKRGEEKKNVYWRVNSEEDLININKKSLPLQISSASSPLPLATCIFFPSTMQNSALLLWRLRALTMPICSRRSISKPLAKCSMILPGRVTEPRNLLSITQKRLQTALWMLFRRFRREPSSRILTVQTKNSRKNAGAGQKNFTATPCPNTWQAAFSVSLIQLSVTASVCFMLSQKGLLRKAKETATL